MHNYYKIIILMLVAFTACRQERPETAMPLPSEIAPSENEKLASGTVFNDNNKNQVMDEEEQGIPGVAVSNGREVVITDRDGRYGLPVSDDAIIFVIKPNGWMTPVNEVNLPQFYYIHKPGGSPSDFKYKGVAPTGELPEEINFPLYQETGTSNYKMVVFGDPQPYSADEVDYVAEDIVHELIGSDDLEFGMTMGDIVGDSLPLFNPLNRAVALIGIPWYNVMGNHDINFEASRDELSDETFERVFGPSTYAFVYGDVHFIVVDDIIYPRNPEEGGYVGGLRPEQLTFVGNYLKAVPKDDLVVLTMHIPLEEHGDSFRQSDQKKLFELLKDHPHTLSISAHTHVLENKFFHADSTNWSQPQPHHHFNVGTTSGSWWNGMKGETDIPHTMMRDGTPNGYSIIQFNGVEYIIDWKVAGSPADHQMNIHTPRRIVAGSGTDPKLTVNFFNGSERTVVEYRVFGEQEWRPMKKVNKPDPYYVKLAERWEHFEKLGLVEQWNNDPELADEPLPGRDLPRPRESSHIWEASIGTDWPVGRVAFEIRVKDMYGRTFTDYHSVRIVGSEAER